MGWWMAMAVAVQVEGAQGWIWPVGDHAVVWLGGEPPRWAERVHDASEQTVDLDGDGVCLRLTTDAPVWVGRRCHP